MSDIEIEGVVINGNALGRTIGFPTANMDIAEGVVIENGVYRSTIEIDGKIYDAMSNVGTRPSVDGTTRLLETHVLNFNGNLYGRRLKLRLLEKIRDEVKFSSIEALQQQLLRDRDYVARQAEGISKKSTRYAPK
ncbi:MAG: riboflavin kinase [Alistipes sp.]|nr:riboflavin kinase [Alistipes sp.]